MEQTCAGGEGYKHLRHLLLEGCEGRGVLREVAQQAARLGAHARLPVAQQRRQPLAHVRLAERLVLRVARGGAATTAATAAATSVTTSASSALAALAAWIGAGLVAAAAASSYGRRLSDASEMADDQQRIGERRRGVGRVQKQREQAPVQPAEPRVLRRKVAGAEDEAGEQPDRHLALVGVDGREERQDGANQLGVVPGRRQE